MNPRSHEAAKIILAELAKKYPKMFSSKGVRPLACGAFQQIRKDTGIKSRELSAALYFYTNTIAYQKAMLKFAYRYHPKGGRAEVVTAENRAYARKELTRLQTEFAANQLRRKQQAQAKSPYKKAAIAAEIARQQAAAQERANRPLQAPSVPAQCEGDVRGAPLPNRSGPVVVKKRRALSKPVLPGERGKLTIAPRVTKPKPVEPTITAPPQDNRPAWIINSERLYGIKQRSQTNDNSLLR